ncbi:MAG: RNA polymerase sigma factor [Puniceicoccaceae bacterium]|nr:MAG: RNA polymerase sigma factor [Puniceicoccaceae bacterium]
MPKRDFSSIVDAYYRDLFRFALSLARNPDDAADLTQQTFFIYAEKQHTVRNEKAVKSWLFTTLYREFLRNRRHANRFEPMSVEDGPNHEPTESDDPITAVDAQTALDCLQQLDDTFRAPLTLFYLEDFSYQEIANVLDIPIGTVMSRLSRGKSQIRKRLRSSRQTSDGSVIPFNPPLQRHG